MPATGGVVHPGEHVVQAVAELVKQRLDLVVRQQRGLAADRRGEVARQVGDRRLLAVAAAHPSHAVVHPRAPSLLRARVQVEVETARAVRRRGRGSRRSGRRGARRPRLRARGWSRRRAARRRRRGRRSRGCRGSRASPPPGRRHSGPVAASRCSRQRPTPADRRRRQRSRANARSSSISRCACGRERRARSCRNASTSSGERAIFLARERSA